MFLTSGNLIDMVSAMIFIALILVVLGMAVTFMVAAFVPTRIHLAWMKELDKYHIIPLVGGFVVILKDEV